MAKLLSIPRSPSAVMLLLSSYALALATQGRLSPWGIALAGGSLALAILTYDWTFGAMGSRSLGRAIPGIALDALPYLAALAAGDVRAVEMALPAAAAVALYASLAVADGGPRTPLAMAVGSASLALMTPALAGLMGYPTWGTAVAGGAFLSFTASEVMYVEARLSTRDVNPAWAIVALAPGLALAAAAWPPYALPFIEPLVTATRDWSRRVEPRQLRRFGRRQALRSAAFVAILLALLVVRRILPPA